LDLYDSRMPLKTSHCVYLSEMSVLLFNWDEHFIESSISCDEALGRRVSRKVHPATDSTSFPEQQ